MFLQCWLLRRELPPWLRLHHDIKVEQLVGCRGFVLKAERVFADLVSTKVLLLTLLAVKM
jgi:hypothetical protein